MSADSTTATAPKAARTDGPRFRFGHVLARSAWLLVRHIHVWAVIGFVTAAVVVVPALVASTPRWWRPGMPSWRRFEVVRDVTLTDFLPALWRTAVVIAAYCGLVGAAGAAARGHAPGPRAFVAGLRRIVPFLGTLLMTAVLAVPTVLFYVLGCLLIVTLGGLGFPAGPHALVLGLAFFGGMAVAWAMLFVAVPACVLEEKGPSDAVNRCRRLTLLARWPVFGFAVLLLGLYVAVNALDVPGVLGPAVSARDAILAHAIDLALRGVLVVASALVTALTLEELVRIDSDAHLEEALRAFE